MLWPSADGSLSLLLTSGLMMIERNPPQPSATGTEKLLSTSEFSFRRSESQPFSLSVSGVPGFPEIDVFGGLGDVFPLVSLSWIGLDSEPM